MLRITVVDASCQSVRLRVEGRLTGRSVAELRQTCDLHFPGPGVPLMLDLADVSFADAEGIALLRSLMRDNVTLVNPSPFLAIQVGDREGQAFPPAT
jgi:anti-anti-sigma regulatory factor